jgi:hypothetical protein
MKSWLFSSPDATVVLIDSPKCGRLPRRWRECVPLNFHFGFVQLNLHT